MIVKYIDFGSTTNGKLASRLKLPDHINLRGSVSTGFRVPSLAQSYYSLHFTNINAAGATEILLSLNDSLVKQSFKIHKLKQETAVNYSLWITSTFGSFIATVGGYMINVNDRIVLTSYFDALSKGLVVDQAQFFANSADTKTVGLDIVLAWKKKIANSFFGIIFVTNFNDMKIEKVYNGALDAETFFGKREQAYLLASAPKNKFGLNLNYSQSKFDTGLAFNHFSKIVLVDYAGFDNGYNTRIKTDLTLGDKMTNHLKLTLGSNNLFNAYPTKQDESGNTEAGRYLDAVQMGFNGAYYYARLGFNF